MSREIIEENPQKIKEAELIVAIPSYCEADNIAFPTSQATEGLIKYFPNKKSVLINCDNNSNDGTKEVFFNTNTKTIPQIYLSTPPGIRGKGNNFHNLFRKAVELKANAIVVVDADLKSITPEWIKYLADPLFNGFEYVTPLYTRHKYDGTITNSIAYPLIRTLYGHRIRQPIGGDFGFSGKLAQTYLYSDSWNDSIRNFGIDIWMTTLAINNRKPICQAYLGRPKIHKPKDPGADLGPMFTQVVGTIFHLMLKNNGYWINVQNSHPTPIFGFGLGDSEIPPPVTVDSNKLLDKFKKGINSHWSLWEQLFTKPMIKELNEISSLSIENFKFPGSLWAKILFKYAISYCHDNSLEKKELIASLIPLQFAKTLAFVKKTKKMDLKQTEEFIEQECIEFEKNKHFLFEYWKKEYLK